MQYSIIIPVRDEADTIARCLGRLAVYRDRAEVIVVDGGSRDETVVLATPLCDRLLSAEPGRALQMNAGARQATGEFLLFLHADTVLPGLPTIIGGQSWGFYRVCLSGSTVGLGVVAWFMNLRSKLTHVATGDQALFVHRSMFKRLGGFAEIALMEDIDLCKRLRRLGRPAIQQQAVVTSSRRWEQRGLVRTVLTMWILRLAYVLGVQPSRLARLYYG